ncbi:MAG: hypothetical protein BGO80_11650 [Devosia sp. 63-57]|nr:MAG: hypothetical protein ABS74_18200 [Pelagibacterium sp. SCN 63-126]ODU83234.1 MAG: hypothetical protein ABT14_16035 [Pelagibacterium sp. SCN 63-17]OJX43579.1 MAG: hypothetical protein BGO80_11650 [Devosia sp. 63-57]
MHTREAKFGQIELVDKGIDNADRFVRIHIILKARRQKAHLITFSNFNETSHLAPPKQCQIIP